MGSCRSQPHPFDFFLPNFLPVVLQAEQQFSTAILSIAIVAFKSVLGAAASKIFPKKSFFSPQKGSKFHGHSSQMGFFALVLSTFFWWSRLNEASRKPRSAYSLRRHLHGIFVTCLFFPGGRSVLSQHCVMPSSNILFSSSLKVMQQLHPWQRAWYSYQGNWSQNTLYTERIKVTLQEELRSFFSSL